MMFPKLHALQWTKAGPPRRRPDRDSRASKTYRSQDFKKLEREWYAKLKATGFEDIEFNESSPFVKDNHLRIRRRVRRGWRTGQQALFEAATDYLSGATASRRSERIHAALFVAGVPAAKIAARLGVTLRSVQKHVYGFIARVREDANAYEAEEAEQQAQDGGAAAGGSEAHDEEVDLSRASDNAGSGAAR